MKVSKSRNSSKTALKTRGINWTKSQLAKISYIAGLEAAPSIDIVKENCAKLSDEKAEAMLLKVKQKRKELAGLIGLNNDISGIRNSAGAGEIYIVENELFEGWIKIGMTTNLTSRVNTYNCSDPLKRFRVIVNKQVNDRRRAEAVLKHNIGIVASLSNGEWFRIEKRVALDIFKAIS